MDDYNGAHAANFMPPWKWTVFRKKHGFWIQLSRAVAVFAVPPDKPDRSGHEAWSCQLLSGLSRKLEDKFSVHVGPSRDAAYDILSKALKYLDVEAAGKYKAAAAAWKIILDAQEAPDDPILIQPEPGRWYDPRKRLPRDPSPVIIAWTAINGAKRGGDRTAIYKDGGWYWAFGRQDKISPFISVDAWMACPSRPPEWGQD